MDRSLRELDGELVSVSGRPQQEDCLLFTCPVCRTESGELTGHGIMVSFRPPSLFPNGCVWGLVSGASVDDMSLSPSINCNVIVNGHESDCKFHGWVTDGRVRW